MDRQLISSWSVASMPVCATASPCRWRQVASPTVPAGRKIGVFGNVAGYDGHGAAGFGITDVLHDTKNYQVQVNGAVGVGFETRVVGARGGMAVFWQMAPSVLRWPYSLLLPQDASPA
jgi:hypothetical protein